MWKDSCEHDGMMAFVDASDWWGPEGVAWVPCDGWRCIEAWSMWVVDLVLMVEVSVCVSVLVTPRRWAQWKQ